MVATIDDGTKVSHLTYVGDDVSKNVNFGCGTVLVNYNGAENTVQPLKITHL